MLASKCISHCILWSTQRISFAVRSDQINFSLNSLRISSFPHRIENSSTYALHPTLVHLKFVESNFMSHKDSFRRKLWNALDVMIINKICFEFQSVISYRRQKHFAIRPCVLLHPKINPKKAFAIKFHSIEVRRKIVFLICGQNFVSTKWWIFIAEHHFWVLFRLSSSVQFLLGVFSCLCSTSAHSLPT